MGYRLNRLDEPFFMAVSKPLLTEFGIDHTLESCVGESESDGSKSRIKDCLNLPPREKGVTFPG